MAQSLLDFDAIDGARPLRLAARSVLFRPNDECPGFVVVHKGQIKVSLVTESGREIVLYRVKPGEICLQTFACLVRRMPYNAEGVVESDLEGLVVPTSQFDRLMAQTPAFRTAVFAAMAVRFDEFQHVVETLAFSGLDMRVAQALLTLGGAADEVEATHESIAAEIGSAREAVSRQLAAFVREGLVETARGRIKILARSRLTRLARGHL